jgi:hypothetical protein
MQPYNYSIDLPAPPASTFLQDLMGIQQMKNLRQQREIQAQQAEVQAQQAKFAQELQPLERQKLEAAIAAQRASTAQSGAATNLLGVQTTAAKLGLADKQLISSTLQNYFNDETKTVKDLAPILPLLDATAVENLGKAEQIRVNNEVSTRLNEGKEITASDIRGWSNRQTLLRGPEQQQFQQSFLAMTPQFQSAAKSGMINAVNAAFAGNMEAARNSAAEVQQALLNSKDTSPAAKAVSDSFGKIVNLIDQNPNIPKEVLALNVVNAAGLVGDENLSKQTLNIVKEFGDQTKPGSAAAGVEIKDVFTKDLIAKSTEKVNEYTKKSDLAYGVLEKINTGEIELPKSFVGRWIQKEIKDAYPLFSNEITALKKDFIKIKNSEAAKNLPPGSASNQDVQFAKEGLTSENASPVQFKKAVESMARLYRLDAKYEEAKAAWLSTNGNLGNSGRDISVLGTDVAKGTGFNQWWKKSGSNLVSEQAGAPAPSPTDLTMPPAGAVRRVR